MIRKTMNGCANVAKMMSLDASGIYLVNGLENFAGNFERTESFSVDFWFYPTAARPTALIGRASNAPTRRGWFDDIVIVNIDKEYLNEIVHGESLPVWHSC